MREGGPEGGMEERRESKIETETKEEEECRD